MRPRLLLSMAVLVACLGFAPAPFPKSRPGGGVSDLARLQGTWDVIERYRHGSTALMEGTQVKIAGTGLDFIIQAEVRSRWELQLDPATSPRTMDWKAVKTPFFTGNDMLGIYRFEGDRLHLYCAEPKTPRPTVFDGKGSGGYLLIMRRSGR